VSPTDIPVPQDRPTEVETETPEALPAEITRLEPVTGDSELVNKSPKRESPCEIDFGDSISEESAVKEDIAQEDI
jgi:hypothetical protein